jgi:hypothetical protein
MIDDKKTIGLTPENRSVMDQIMEKGFFREQKEPLSLRWRMR